MEKKVKDLMILAKDYACVGEEDSLFDVIVTLEDIQKKHRDLYYKHRAVLVCDQTGKIVGKIGQIDVLKALDPQYKQLGDIGILTRFGINLDFIDSMKKQFVLLQEPLTDLCRKVARIKAREAMHAPLAGEVIEAEASINEAVHHFIVGHHQSLLVTDKGTIIGILRLSDVFMEIAEMIKECRIP